MTRLEALEAVAEAARKLDRWPHGVSGNGAIVDRDALAAVWRAMDTLDALPAEPQPQGETVEAPYQTRVHEWMLACFGPAISADATERCHRFVEEALELSQACGGTAEDAHKLVDYVFGRDIGERAQEVGGVMVTLAALCNAFDLDMDDASAKELARCWRNIERIRAKQAAKPIRSPLPIPAPPAGEATP